MIDLLAESGVAFVGGVLVVLGVFIMAVLRRESGVPLVLSALFVPPIIAAGFGISVVIHVWLAVPVVHASGLLGVVLFAFLLAYEGVSASESPKHRRHRF